ncbi:MAG: DEAD/DEAH box helicase [Gemmataceae bacterium]
MRLQLKEFQEDAVAKLVRHMRAASKDSKAGDRQSVCLSSPTGSGKTVMLTRAIELILQGDEDQAPISDATFLWVTDQPELNEQTRRKMLATSSVLTSELLLVLDASYDQETLKPGTVHFLNTQKLGKDKGFISRGDKRDYTFWDIIRNTLDTRASKFFVIIDEAHRGMSEGKEQADATTIIQKFIKGAQPEIPPIPLIVGISATPERFNRLITGTGRMTRPIDVDVADVRSSGLIKETIILHHPKKEQPTDMTMLREAAKSLKEFTKRWGDYCATQDDVQVAPLLVVQVEDSGGKGKISETDIAQAMRILRDTLGTVPNDAFAHSFQEKTAVKIDGEDLRYLAPSDIQDDQDVRVIFFKTSLNTGWDCPRAEVMMSFRAAADSTYIAQLVGRMVRTPLARTIVDNETLNTVGLYLPHYDSKGLKHIVDRLTKHEDDLPPVDVEDADDLIELHKAKGSEKLFEALAELPSYFVPRRRKANQVRRVMKLARLLTNHDILDDALAIAKKQLLAVINSEYNRLKRTKRFKEIVEDRSQIEIEAVNWEVGADTLQEGQSVKVDIASENVEDLFEAVGRKLNEGLHKLWWRDRVQNAPADREKAKLELFALCIDPEFIRKIETTATDLVQTWFKRFNKSIKKMDDASRNAYEEVWNLAAESELMPLSYPANFYGRESDRTWEKHLYVSDANTYPCTLNDTEDPILAAEIEPKNVVGWLRNIDRKKWALCVPYEVDGEERSMFPDFLIIRSEGGQLVTSILDPHSIGLADAPAKAAGLAKFAAKHAGDFGKIELIMLDGTKSKRFDLTEEKTRKKIMGLKLVDQMKQLMD